MKSNSIAASIVLGTPLAAALAGNSPAPDGHAKRASPDAPSGYVPDPVACPSPLPTIRDATSGLSEEERDWLETRRPLTTDALRIFLDNVAVDGLDTGALFDTSDPASDLPTLAIALSGGGYRAMLNGAGVLQALDERTGGDATDAGKGGVGGLLQVATYLAGLSGGSWMVGSMYVQNFSTVGDILDGNPTKGVWELDQSIFAGPADLKRFEYYGYVSGSVSAKEDAGYNTTITDLWGRALSYQLINAEDGGPAYTFSSIANNSFFTQGRAPLPLLVAVQRPPGTLNVTLDDPVYEFNPWEMGSYDPSVAAFAPLRYIGSPFRNGTLNSNSSSNSGSASTCICGYDNAGFVMGTSSSLFNGAFLAIARDDDEGRLNAYVESTLEVLGQEDRDIAWWPNPFRGYGDMTLGRDSDVLTLVDGGMALENIPFRPLLWQPRGVDVIIAVDSSADTPNHWPNGTAMVATYQHSQETSTSNGDGGSDSRPFPQVPAQNSFVNLGLNNRPTFFGCPSEYTPGTSVEAGMPLVIYLPQSPYTYLANFSTYSMSYSDKERDAVIENGRNVATRGMGEVDDQWPQCLACAVVMRSLQRRDIEFPKQCGDCFDRYCWDGEVKDEEPSEAYEPELEMSGSWRMGAGESLWLVVLAMWGLLLLV